MTRLRIGRVMVAELSLFVACGSQSSGQGIRPITEAESMVALYTEDWGLRPSGPSPPQLIVAAWDDGRILWSDDRLNGGPPYREAKVNTSQLTGLLNRLAEDGLFDIDELANPQFGPDSPFTTILVKWSGKQLKMQSWHELVEDGQRGIVRKTGIVAIERPRFQVLKEEPTDYLFYRFVWAEIRARALSLIPRSGDIVDGQVVRDSGDLSWQETNKRQ